MHHQRFLMRTVRENAPMHVCMSSEHTQTCNPSPPAGDMLHTACITGDAAYAKQLLDEGLVDAVGLDPRTRRSALHLACMHDQPGVIRWGSR